MDIRVKKGQVFICLRTIKGGTYEPRYYTEENIIFLEGKEYKSSEDNCILNEKQNQSYITSFHLEHFFRLKISEK